MIFAIAHDLDEAKAKAIESGGEYYSNWITREIAEKEPQVLDIAPVAFHVCGSG